MVVVPMLGGDGLAAEKAHATSIAVILPLWLFWDEFRAWEFGAARVVAALAGLGLGVVAGLLVAGLASGLPALFTGASAAAVFTVVYAVIWFHGVHWLARRTG